MSSLFFILMLSLLHFKAQSRSLIKNGALSSLEFPPFHVWTSSAEFLSFSDHMWLLKINEGDLKQQWVRLGNDSVLGRQISGMIHQIMFYPSWCF